MLRKLYKLTLLSGLVVLSTGSEMASGQAASQAVTTASASAAAAAAKPAARVAIWAATAEYVYRNDAALKPILKDLLATTKAGSMEEFKRGLNEAVRLEKKTLTDSHVYTFQTKVFDPVQKKRPANPEALAVAIEQELLRTHQERSQQPEFKAFVADIKQLAGAQLPPAPGAPVTGKPTAPATDAATNAKKTTEVETPQAEDTTLLTRSSLPGSDARAVAGEQDAAVDWLAWLPLVLSVVSLIASGLAWKKASEKPQVPSAPAVPSQPERPNPTSPQKDVTWDEMRKYVNRQLDERLAAPVVAAPTPPPVQSVAAPAALPAPRLRTQYINEAPFNGIFRAPTDQQQSFSIFAIESSEQQPDLGTFTVTGNSLSHIRNHRSVLEPVCDYAGSYPLGSETRLVVETPGQVRRTADGNWELVKRARVRFEA